MAPKSFLLTDAVSDYLLAHQDPLDEIEQSLIETTKALGGVSGMQIAPEQGRFMQLFASLLGAKRAVEVGSFTGYSALQLVRGMGEGSHLLCCDVSEEWTALGRTLVIAPATETLAALPLEPTFDLAFIDADKPGYHDYYEAIVPRLAPNGVLLIDNVLWHGAVTDPADTNESTEIIRRFNDHVAADPRTESTILPIGDGLTMVRRTR